jgi:uncharacterized lipoprotein YmbA
LTEPTLEQLEQGGAEAGLYAIGRIQLSTYLSGAGLVYHLGDNQVHEARQHRWAEPLQGQLRRQLRQGLQQQLPQTRWLPFGGPQGQATDFQLELQVDAFHITDDGDVRVAGQWQLHDHTQALVADGRFDEQRPLAADGYPAAVAALSSAWHRSLYTIALGLADAHGNN